MCIRDSTFFFAGGFRRVEPQSAARAPAVDAELQLRSELRGGAVVALGLRAPALGVAQSASAQSL
eukprot:15125560-Alexandrium_andersonii.AAC.1